MNERQINTIISTIGRVGREHANRRPGDQTGYSTRLRRAIEPLLEELNGGGTHRKIQMAWDVLRFHGHPQEGNEPLHTAIADLLDEKNEEIARLKSQIAGKSSLRELGRAWGGAATLTLENAPIGAFAPSSLGGGWTKNERGWESSSGNTFPRPGGDWTGEIRV